MGDTTEKEILCPVCITIYKIQTIIYSSYAKGLELFVYVLFSHGSLLLSLVLRTSAEDFMFCGSLADLDTACCHTLSSKQLTNAAVVVSVMVVVRGGRTEQT